MKKILSILILGFMSIAFIKCVKDSNTPNPTPVYKITFDTQGGGEITSIKVKKQLNQRTQQGQVIHLQVGN